MDRMPTQADSFQQVASVTSYIMTLSPEKQFSEIESIIQGSIAAIKYQDITGLTTTL
jgi:hypothetical protein